MFYNDGVDIDGNSRAILCPKCKNEEFSGKAEFCRICGTGLYNKCEGEWDSYNDYLVQHDNPGNARFCETCGKPTLFFKEGFLKDWEQVQAECIPEQNTNDANFDIPEEDPDIPF